VTLAMSGKWEPFAEFVPNVRYCPGRPGTVPGKGTVTLC
jgi:hypothetical protein